MDFKEATDELFEPLSHAELAKVLGVSVASIRQARLSISAIAHRSPPDGWEDAVARLAEKRAAHYRELVEQIRGQNRRSHNI